MIRDFQQVDVFGARPYGGNPVAVVLDGEGLDTATMQRVARWTNLSETTFVLPPTTPDADYRLRIFTLNRELPFAGHPTLGSCHAWLTAGGQPRHLRERSGASLGRASFLTAPPRGRLTPTPHSDDVIVQECGAGLITVRRDPTHDRLAFAAPPLIRSGPVDPEMRTRVVRALRIADDDVVDMAWVDNGPGWVGVLLADADAVLAVEPDPAAFSGPDHLDIGLVGRHPAGAVCAIEVRALFSGSYGEMLEDPVTGSLNASLAEWLTVNKRVTAPYVAAQGTPLGRFGRAHIDRGVGGIIWVGGDTTTAITGSIDI